MSVRFVIDNEVHGLPDLGGGALTARAGIIQLAALGDGQTAKYSRGSHTADAENQRHPAESPDPRRRSIRSILDGFLRCRFGGRGHRKARNCFLAWLRG